MDEGWKPVVKFRSSLNSSDELKEGMMHVISDNTCIQKDPLSVPVYFAKGRNLAICKCTKNYLISPSTAQWNVLSQCLWIQDAAPNTLQSRSAPYLSPYLAPTQCLLYCMIISVSFVCTKKPWTLSRLKSRYLCIPKPLKMCGIQTVFNSL